MNKDQVELINTLFAAFGIEVPEISKGVASDLLKAFTAFTKALSSKGATKKSKKVKDPNAPKRPVNVYFAWLALYRASLRVQNGNSEDGLSDLLKSEYEKFRETSDYQKLKKECEEKMKVYKEEMSEYTTSEASGTDEDEDEDDDSKGKKAKKVPKAKKPEKSPEEKQPPNVYMTFRNKYLASIKANLKEGENLAEVLKEKYEEFKSTKEHNTLQEKCKADFAKWKEEKGSSSESEEAPKTAAKKTAAKEASKTSSKKEKQQVDSDSDSDDDTFTMPKAPEKAPEKAPKIKEKVTKKKAVKKVDSDDDE
jgi:hypothetical protein